MSEKMYHTSLLDAINRMSVAELVAELHTMPELLTVILEAREKAHGEKH